jgi:glycosyltransferase involved in cell wall biosynthesis
MISVIIPVYNEGHSIGSTLAYLYANASYKRLLKEVIVVDGGSTDNTVAEAEKTGATVMRCLKKSRAARLNYGAKQATGKIFYFLQSSSLPPQNFISEIVKAYSKGFASGTFSLKYSASHWLLNAFCWVTSKYPSWVQLSDQSLFITKELFEKSGGFREDHLVMINQEMIRRIKRYSDFIVLKDTVLSSAGKYLRYGILKTGMLHVVVYVMHKLGYPQHQMTRLYRRFLRWDIGPKPKRVEKPLTESLVMNQSPVQEVSLQSTN